MMLSCPYFIEEGAEITSGLALNRAIFLWRATLLSAMSKISSGVFFDYVEVDPCFEQVEEISLWSPILIKE